MTDPNDAIAALRLLVADMDAHAIVTHVEPHYHGWQVDGEWLDAWRDAVEGELARIEGALADAQRA